MASRPTKRELGGELGHSFALRDYAVSTLVFFLAYQAFVLFQGTPGAAAGGAVVEPSTGIAFAPSLRVDGKALSLLGVGVRTKLVVNVYAVAFYAEPAPMRAAAARFVALPPAKLRGEPRLFAALADASAAKHIVLTFARDVGAAKVAEALSAVPGASAKARAELATCIVGQGNLKKGDQLALSWRGKDGLAVKGGSGAATLCSFRDRPLAAGLLGMYLGTEAVSPKLRTSIADGVKALHA
jgi:hypothetical protein